jgi:hypothetical protein
MWIVSEGKKLDEVICIDSLYCSDCNSKEIIDYEFHNVSEIAFNCNNCRVINYKEIGGKIANI